MAYVPTKIFFSKGAGVSKERLTSYEMALRAAGIAKYNLVHVSSIFPPQCKIISRQEGDKLLKPGQIVHTVLSRNDTNEPSRLIAASVGAAIPANKKIYGYLSEHEGYGQTERFAGEYAEDLAATMMATTLGVEFDPEKSWDEQKEIWKISGHIVRTRNITQTAKGNKDKLWTTVVAVAVLLP